MRQTQLFTKTRKEAPKDEVSKNAQLLIRAGYIHKLMAGVYEFMPMGLRVMNKISTIVREEMNQIGGTEVKMTILQDPEPWKLSNRWEEEKVDNWFKTHLANGAEIGLGFTHEEPLTNMLKSYIHSYRDLPIYPYQIQAKFRNEMRAKSGIMRGREFLMKDMYSYSRNTEEHEVFYEKMKEVYMRVFERAGIGEQTFVTVASGGSFSKFSHEFQMISEVGEDTIYVDREKSLAVNKEVYTDEVLEELGMDKESLEEHRSVEVGNIFPLGTRFAEAVSLRYEGEEGDMHYPVMGSYGIGIGRLMGALVEISNDDQGIIWPEAVAPYLVHVVVFGKEGSHWQEAEDLYEACVDAGIEVLFDDRKEVRPGEKFADADLVGIPYRVVVSARSLENGGYEFTQRAGGESEIVTTEILLEKLKR
jgi:prolyl-tRNA synthetase